VSRRYCVTSDATRPVAFRGVERVVYACIYFIIPVLDPYMYNLFPVRIHCARNCVTFYCAIPNELMGLAGVAEGMDVPCRVDIARHPMRRVRSRSDVLRGLYTRVFILLSLF
jgi:hypothetical protein